MVINTQEIIERGFVFEEEMEELYEDGRFNGFRRMFWTEQMDERFHGIQLNDTHFVICNNLLFIQGPRSMVGMVAVFDMKRTSFVMNHEKSFAIWGKAGQAAIDYYYSRVDNKNEEERQ